MLHIKTHYKKAYLKFPFARNSIKTGGFTIAEVLVSLSIIILLVSVTLSSALAARDKARAVRSIAEMDQISGVVTLLRHEAKVRIRDLLPLLPIGSAGYDCPECPCRITNRLNALPVPLDPNLKNIDDIDPCAVKWNQVVTQFKNNGFPIDGMERDPWGSPYLFDPNEGEDNSPFNGPCDRKDTITSAGPNGIFGKVDALGNWEWDLGSDIMIQIPHSRFAYNNDADPANDAHCYAIRDERSI